METSGVSIPTPKLPVTFPLRLTVSLNLVIVVITRSVTLHVKYLIPMSYFSFALRCVLESDAQTIHLDIRMSCCDSEDEIPQKLKQFTDIVYY